MSYTHNYPSIQAFGESFIEESLSVKLFINNAYVGGYFINATEKDKEKNMEFN
ncbi:unnamed protein product [Brassica oleracea var. botrytis]